MGAEGEAWAVNGISTLSIAIQAIKLLVPGPDMTASAHGIVMGFKGIHGTADAGLVFRHSRC